MRKPKPTNKILVKGFDRDRIATTQDDHWVIDWSDHPWHCERPDKITKNSETIDPVTYQPSDYIFSWIAQHTTFDPKAYGIAIYRVMDDDRISLMEVYYS